MKNLFMALAMMLIATGAAKANTTPLEGQWVIAEALGSASMGFTQEAVDESEEAVGQTIRVEGNQVVLNTGKTCEMTSIERETKDDYGFGSIGGAWSRIGLEPKENGYEYEVTMVTLNCEVTSEIHERKTRRIMVGNQGRLVLLNIHETWVRLERPAAE